MSRIEHLARTSWFDLLIAVLAIVAIGPAAYWLLAAGISFADSLTQFVFPARPNRDLCALLAETGIGATWRDRAGWSDADPAALDSIPVR